MGDYEKIINDQISREMDASLFYYALQLKFTSQSLNRPNFAKMLGERVAEKRDHGHMLAELQQSRGYDVELKQISKSNVWTCKSIGSAFDAMIEKETSLTKGYLLITNLKPIRLKSLWACILVPVKAPRTTARATVVPTRMIPSLISKLARRPNCRLDNFYLLARATQGHSRAQSFAASIAKLRL